MEYVDAELLCRLDFGVESYRLMLSTHSPYYSKEASRPGFEFDM